MRLSHVRISGLLLLLTAVATAVSVMTRLSSSMEPPEVAALPVPQVPIILDTGLYTVSGLARVVSGLALLAAAVFLRRAMAGRYWMANVAGRFLEASGTITAVSSACMLALAAALPEAGPTVVLTYGGGSPDWVESVDAARWIAGKVGFTLAGLGLIALGPVQWRIGGLLKVSAVADVIVGVAMLFIWVDAATVMHRVSGIAFLVWLIVSGVWLAAGLLKSPANSAAR